MEKITSTPVLVALLMKKFAYYKVKEEFINKALDLEKDIFTPSDSLKFENYDSAYETYCLAEPDSDEERHALRATINFACLDEEEAEDSLIHAYECASNEGDEEAQLYAIHELALFMLKKAA